MFQQCSSQYCCHLPTLNWFSLHVSATFYAIPCINDFITEVLVGSTQPEIRNKALEQFDLLSHTEVMPMECTGHQQTPHQFMVQTLLKARLPFWVSSSLTRGTSYRQVFLFYRLLLFYQSVLNFGLV